MLQPEHNPSPLNPAAAQTATSCATSAHQGPVTAAANLTFTVTGHPTPQGSKRAWVQNGRAMMAEQTGDRLRAWRQDVKAAAIAVRPATPIDTPVRVTHCFAFPRPKAHFGTGRNATRLKDSAPAWPTSRSTGDIEKLVRSTHDAITIAAVWVDDSLVVQLDVVKVYADSPAAVGDVITITPLDQQVEPTVPVSVSVAQTCLTDTEQAADPLPGAAEARHLETPSQGEGSDVNGCRANTTPTPSEGRLW